MEYVAKVQYTPSSNTHVITHKGEIKDFLFKRFAPYLVNIFGGTGILICGKTFPFLLPLASAVMLMLFPISRSGNFDWMSCVIIGLMYPVMVLMLKLGNQFSNVAMYYRESKCEKCGEEFACEEFRIPDIKEISTPDNYSFQIIRYWKCRSCGFENVRKSSEGFVAKKGETIRFSFLAKVPCKKCGKTDAYVEYKKPDIREINRDIIRKTMIRRYYRCKLCGYEDIQAFDEHHSGGDNPVSSNWMITYEDLP